MPTPRTTACGTGPERRASSRVVALLAVAIVGVGMLGVALVGGALACWATGYDPFGSHGPTSKAQRPRGALGQYKKVEFLVFGAKWCDVCREVPPVLDRLRQEFPAVAFRELDYDLEENQKLYSKYHIGDKYGLPYMVVLGDGQVIGRVIGLIPYEQLAKFLRDAIAAPPIGD